MTKKNSFKFLLIFLIVFLTSNITSYAAKNKLNFVEDDPRIFISNPDKDNNITIKYTNGVTAKKPYNGNINLLMINGTFVPEEIMSDYIPIRTLAKYLDIEVEWLPKQRQVLIAYNGKKSYFDTTSDPKSKELNIGNTTALIIDNQACFRLNQYFSIGYSNLDGSMYGMELGENMFVSMIDIRPINFERKGDSLDEYHLVNKYAKETYDKIMNLPDSKKIDKAKFKKYCDPTKFRCTDDTNPNYTVFAFYGYKTSENYYIFFSRGTGKLYSAQIGPHTLKIEEGFINIEALVD